MQTGLDEIRLPQSTFGRIRLALACLLVAPVSALGLFLLLVVVPPPKTLAGWAFHIAGDIVLIESTVFSLFGLVWSITQAAWVERVVRAASRKLKIGLCLLSLLIVSAILSCLFL